MEISLKFFDPGWSISILFIDVPKWFGIFHNKFNEDLFLTICDNYFFEEICWFWSCLLGSNCTWILFSLLFVLIGWWVGGLNLCLGIHFSLKQSWCREQFLIVSIHHAIFCPSLKRNVLRAIRSIFLQWKWLKMLTIFQADHNWCLCKSLNPPFCC